MSGKRLRAFSLPRGFTMMELLVVLVIVALLAALVGPSIFQQISPAKQSVAKAQIENFMSALDAYFIDTGEFPSEQDGLKSLREKPAAANKWNGPYLKKVIPKDPWGHEYGYRSPGRNGGYEIFSFGRDGVQGGEGEAKDIVSWDGL